jgi:hypothetical protein
MTVSPVIETAAPDLAVPDPPLQHLVRLSDDTGVFEHARHATVRREHGYCTDDVARGLVVISREADPPAEIVRLAERYLAFLTHAQTTTAPSATASDSVVAGPASPDWATGGDAHTLGARDRRGPLPGSVDPAGSLPNLTRAQNPLSR